MGNRKKKRKRQISKQKMQGLEMEEEDKVQDTLTGGNSRRTIRR